MKFYTNDNARLRYNLAAEMMTDARSIFVDTLPGSVREQLSNPVAARLLPEYGAIFVAGAGVTPPDRIIFRDHDEVTQFQDSVKVATISFDEIAIELQAAAAQRLTMAIIEASELDLSITPRSADSGRRSYNDTVELWYSRVEPALVHWTARSQLNVATADHIRSLPPFKQVPEVFALEDQGLFFAKDLSKSIIYSVAPPGTSQHLSMLAFDVSEFNEPRVRAILADNFWYQTVTSDLPHFTYLGVSESVLPKLGLKKTFFAERDFWVPDI